MLLFCVFVALAFADEVITSVELNPSGGTLLLTSPWNLAANAKETAGLHYYSDLPTDFYGLPHRYGFRVAGRWVPYPNSPITGFPQNYVPPTTAWMRLCDAVPSKNDDYTLVIQAFGEALAGQACPDRCIPPFYEWTIEALEADGVTTTTIARPSVVKDTNGACLENRMVINLAQLRNANPGKSLFLKLVNKFGVIPSAAPAVTPQDCVNPTRTCTVSMPVCYRGPSVTGVATSSCQPGGTSVTYEGRTFTLCARSDHCGSSNAVCAPAPASLGFLSGTTICQGCTTDSDCVDRALLLTAPTLRPMVCSSTGTCEQSGTRPRVFEFRFQRQGLAWSQPKECTYSPSPDVLADVLAECKPISYNLLDCTNGVYEPTKEECDMTLDPTGCASTCTCIQPRVPDGNGKCSFCGNGAVELVQGEWCDPGNDVNCGSDCKSCAPGFAPNADFRCTKCGNGVADIGEACDTVLDPVRCSATCTCPNGWVGNGRGACTLCGNGVLDAGEVCDNNYPHCNTECTGCASPYVARSALVDKTGACTLCGNGFLDAGEACDWKNDYNCHPDCSGCTPFHNIVNGMCTRCGNGYLDAGEKCDSLRDDCAQDCQRCLNGRTPANDKWGNCGGCGNGVVDPDEVCDTGIDGEKCAEDCGSCQHPYTSVGRRCVTCGNGRLDTVRDADGSILFVEVCDAAQPGCRDDCTGCQAGWDQSGDVTGTCIPQCDACCEALAERTGEGSDDEVASASAVAISFAFFGLLATLL